MDIENIQLQIQQADTVGIWFLISFLSAIAIFVGFGIFRNIHYARSVENTPTSKVRSAAQGYVELIGTGKWLDEKPVMAPLTRQACTWYSYSIEKKEVRHTRNGTSTSWRTIKSGTSHEPFVLEDDTGQCLIFPEKAHVIPSQKDVWYGYSSFPATGPETGSRSFFTGGSYRYKEERMHAGEQIYALGNFVTINESRLDSFDDALKSILSQWKSNQAELLTRFDADKDGEIDQVEWNAAREAASQEVQKQRLERANTPDIHTLMAPGSKRKPFILSVKSQKSMTKRFRIYAFICTVVFLLLGPLAIWIILVRLQW